MHALAQSDAPQPDAAAPVMSIARPPVHPREFRPASRYMWLAHSQANPVHSDTEPRPAIQSLQDLVVQLCRMPVDLAAPLIRGSLPSLDTPALLALIAATGEAHHLLVARRSGLDGRVVKALIRANSDPVLLALADNHELTFDDEDQAVLSRLAHDRPALRDAMLRHPALSPRRWRAIADYGLSHHNLKLLKHLRAGRADAFLLECARRLECEATLLQRIVTGTSSAPLALLCCALGLDRAVFLHLLPYWQSAYPGNAVCNAAQRPLILSVFGLAPDEARRKLLAIG